MVRAASTCHDVRMPRPPTGQTPARAIRVENDIWDAARRRAELDGTTVSRVVRDYLAAYSAARPTDGAPRDPWEVVRLVVKDVAPPRPNTDLPRAAELAAELLRALGHIPASGEES